MFTPIKSGSGHKAQVPPRAEFILGEKLGLPNVDQSWGYRVGKRFMDISISLVSLALLSPIMLLAALIIKLDSPGPIIFRQKRLGLKGKLFTMYKLRTMHVSAPIYSPKKAADDPAITRVGSFLRRTCLDEVPQLVNVLRGEMSLVGPRPEQPPMFEKYPQWQWCRFSVTPGVTGWWQINAPRCVPIYENGKHDIYYVEHRSLWLDIKILTLTLPLVLFPNGTNGAHPADPPDSKH
jgi:lipopolysaccharide/colanic/teichoic acid biosynthesis glycosyltransferase